MDTSRLEHQIYPPDTGSVAACAQQLRIRANAAATFWLDYQLLIGAEVGSERERESERDNICVCECVCAHFFTRANQCKPEQQRHDRTVQQVNQTMRHKAE